MSGVFRKLLHVFFSGMWNFQTAGALLLHLYALVGTHKGMRVLDSNAGWEWVGNDKIVWAYWLACSACMACLDLLELGGTLLCIKW